MRESFFLRWVLTTAAASSSAACKTAPTQARNAAPSLFSYLDKSTFALSHCEQQAGDEKQQSTGTLQLYTHLRIHLLHSSKAKGPPLLAETTNRAAEAERARDGTARWEEQQQDAWRKGKDFPWGDDNCKDVDTRGMGLEEATACG